MLLVLAVLPALAADPEILVVGAHLPGQMGELPYQAADRLADAVDGTGKARALDAGDVSARIAGREALILDTYALGAGRERLKEGTVLYERAQPDQAIPVLSDAVKQLEAGLAVSPSIRDLQDALMVLGLAQVGMGEESGARDTFRRAAVLDPQRQLDTVRFSPDVVELYEGVRKGVLDADAGRLDVTASIDATVWVDGREIGAAPQKNLDLAPGDHYVLVRAARGASHFERVTIASGDTVAIDALLETRALGQPAADASGRARQARDLYRALGGYVGEGVVLLAGETAPGQVGVQLYSPASGTFSRPVTGEAGGDSLGVLIDLVPTVVGYLGENGDIRPDRVSPTALSLDVGTNDLLAGMLFDPPKAEVQTDRGVPWYLWAGIGAAVAGGGAAVAAVVLTGEPEEVPPNQNGTILFGPIP